MREQRRKDGFGGAAQLGDGRVHVGDAVLVQAVGVVVDVAGREAEHGVAGRGQQRAGVVHAEVASGVGQRDGGGPRARRWRVWRRRWLRRHRWLQRAEVLALEEAPLRVGERELPVEERRLAIDFTEAVRLKVRDQTEQRKVADAFGD